jgi:hypothetical protein
MSEPNDYEKRQLDAIVAWRAQEPSVASRAVGVVVAPLARLVQKVVPEAAIRGAIDGASAAGRWLADPGDVRRDAGVGSIAELRGRDLELSDRLAAGVHSWAIALATVEGTATGAFGILGAPVDLPAIITLALRTIHKVGLCYGYECDSQEDRQFAQSVLATAGANSLEEKLAALASLTALRTTLARHTWKALAEKAAQDQLSREAVLLVLRKLAKQVGVNLTKRRALAAIPAVGAMVGGSVNGWYMKEVGWAARRAFQERWLADAGKLAAEG